VDLSQKMKQKKKAHQKPKETPQTIKPEINIEYNKYYPTKFEAVINYVLAGIAVLTSLFFLFIAKTQNGYFCFPLDDSWIHLTLDRKSVV
jgi:hypothetical protein